jgi:hypothetical protein
VKPCLNKQHQQNKTTKKTAQVVGNSILAKNGADES